VVAQFDRQLVVGIAMLLRDAGHGQWNPTGIYQGATTTGIFIMAVPDLPDRLITLTPYAVTDDADEAMSTQGLQVRTRWGGGNPLDVLDLDSAIFDTLHALTMTTLSTGVTLSQCLRRSSASMGQDSSKRWGMSSNYYLDVNRPGPHR
jgi:hypothetical protein